MTAYALELQDQIRTYKQNLRIEDEHRASLVKPANFTPPEPPYPIEGVDCSCGGTLEEGKCDSCDYGHSDCTVQECLQCLETAMGRAEDLYD